MHIIKQKTDESPQAVVSFSKERVIEEMISRIEKVYPDMMIQKDVTWPFNIKKKAKGQKASFTYDLMLIRKGTVTLKRKIGTFGMYEAEEQHPYVQLYLIAVLSPAEELSNGLKRQMNEHLDKCTDIWITHNAGIIMRRLKNDERF